MTLTALILVTTLILAVVAAMAILLFGRAWGRQRQERRTEDVLRKHAGLVAALRAGSEEEFQKGLGMLRAQVPPVFREAILDAAREEADPAVDRRICRAFDDLGLTDRNIDLLRNHPSWERRAVAAERLGRIGSARAVHPLLKAVGDLKDEDADVRGAALRALGRIRDPASIPELIAALGNPEASLPQRIAEILVRFGDEAVAPLCRELRNQDSDVRRMWAAEILGWLGNRGAGIPLMDALGDVNAEVRAKAAGALGKLSDARSIDRMLEMLLSDPIPFVRTRVAQALGAIGHPRVVDHLMRVLKDPEWWVRIRAIEALQHLGRDAGTMLLGALEDEDGEVRRRAATALERMDYVREAVEAQEREGFRADLYRTLLLIGKAGVTEGIFGRIRSARPPANKLLVRLAGDIGDPSAVPVLRELLAESTDPSVRSRAVEAIGKLGARPAVEEILECLKDPDSWVRRAAVDALSSIVPLERPEEALRLLRDPAPETRIAACRLAARMGPEPAGPEVAAMLDDPSPEVRAEAARAAAEMSLPGTEPGLRGLLEDPSREVRTAAALALSRVGTAGSVDSLLRAGCGAGEEERAAIVAALCRCHTGGFAGLAGSGGGTATKEQFAILLEMASRLGGDGRLEFVLGHVASPDPFLRRCAVYALRGFPFEEIGGQVALGLDDPDESVRDAAVLAAAEAEGAEPSREIARKCTDPGETIRFHVALALGLAGRQEHRETLWELAGDSAAAVRAAAVLALSLSGDPRFLQELARFVEDAEMCAVARERFLSSSPDPLVSRLVGHAERKGNLESRLFRGGSLFALEKEMGRQAREALSADVRLQALAVCEVVATGQSYTVALSILRNDPSPEVRARALDLLVRARSDADACRVVSTLLGDPHPRVRLKAARILGQMKFPEAVEALLQALDTVDRDLREEVTTALSAHLLRDPERGEAILSEVPSGKAKKLGIVWLLGKTQSEGAMKALSRYLDDEDGDVRAAAVGALAKYSGSLVLPHLRKSLSDPNPRVRAAAVNALGNTRAEEGEERMVGMLSDPDVFVRQRAAVALLRMGALSAEARMERVTDEPAELQPIWLAGGLLRGRIAPSAAAEHPDTGRFLRELIQGNDALAAIRGSADPAARATAFRVLQAMSHDLCREAAEALSQDPDPALREEAGQYLQRNRS